MSSFDTVSKPVHYNHGSKIDSDGRSYYEPVKVISRRAEPALFWGCYFNVVKYLMRCNGKSSFTEDIRKAIWYINKMKTVDVPDAFMKGMKDACEEARLAAEDFELPKEVADALVFVNQAAYDEAILKLEETIRL